jgi:hypothetical protein
MSGNCGNNENNIANINYAKTKTETVKENVAPNNYCLI